MARPSNPANLAAASAAQVRMVTFVELDLDGTYARANDTMHDFSFDSGSGQGIVTFRGVGGLGEIRGVEETSELVATEITIVLSGIPHTANTPNDNIQTILATQFQGKPAKVWKGFVNEAQSDLVADPIEVWRGRLNRAPFEIGETATVEISALSRFADWDRPRMRRWTDRDQQKQFPTDTGLRFVPSLVDKKIYWGRENPD